MVSIPAESSIATHESVDHIIFVGKMSYEPNIVAVTFFANVIYPHLKKIYPNLKFTIVGANPDIRVKRLEDTSGVTVTGFVESVEPFFQSATVVVAPMLTGAGIQNKIIQAMSYGCCVATTAIGAEGLTIANEEIAIFNNEKEWTKGLKRLLADKSLRKEMGHRAREYIKVNMDKKVIERQFWEFIDYASKKIIR